MPAQDVIKSYLISLGYQVDSTAYNKFLESLKRTEATVVKHSGVIGGAFVKAGIAYATAIGTIATTTGMLVKSIAETDLGYQKTALSLHMAKDAAKQYSIALKVLDQPPEMIAWMPELRKQYMALRQDAVQMELPKEFEKNAKQVRSLIFEFTRLKQESIYSLQWIGFSIMKHLAGPLDRAKFTFKEFNNHLIQNLPQIGSHIGTVIFGIGKIFYNLGRSIKTIGSSAMALWDALTPSSKFLIGMGSLAIIFSKVGPFGKIIILLGIATLAADQFWGALEGKKTELPTNYILIFASAIDFLAEVMCRAMAVAAGFWTMLTLRKDQVAQFFSEVSLGMKKFTKWGMEKSGVSGKELEEQEKSIAETEETIKERKGKMQLRRNIFENYVTMSTHEHWVKEGWMANLVEKYPHFLDTDKMREEAAKDVGAQKDAFNYYSENLEKFLTQFSEMTGTAFPDMFDSDEDKSIKQKSSGSSKTTYDDLIKAASEKFGVDKNLIKAMMIAESGLNKKAISPKGAIGLMQVMPQTAIELGYSPEQMFDPEHSIMAGTKYMANALKQMKGDIPLALAYYNAGPGNVRNYGGVPPFRETQKYIENVMGHYDRLRAAGPVVNGGVNIRFDVTVQNSDELPEKINDNLYKGIMNNEILGLLLGGITSDNYATPFTPPEDYFAHDTVGG
jgi:hypothetical protein